jgi:hypothetical protein
MSMIERDLGSGGEVGSGEAANPLEVHDTGYGSTDIRKGIPQGLVHIPGRRLTVTARAAGIEHRRALVGWGDWRGYPRPAFNRGEPRSPPTNTRSRRLRSEGPLPSATKMVKKSDKAPPAMEKPRASRLEGLTDDIEKYYRILSRERLMRDRALGLSYTPRGRCVRARPRPLAHQRRSLGGRGGGGRPGRGSPSAATGGPSQALREPPPPAR